MKKILYKMQNGCEIEFTVITDKSKEEILKMCDYVYSSCVYENGNDSDFISNILNYLEENQVIVIMIETVKELA